MAIALFDLAEKRLTWADKRQEVLAQNIANANTPHWQAHDLVPFASIMARAQGGALARTNSAHLPGPKGGDPAELTPAPAERAPDGNAVTLDEQLRRIADTETTQELTTTLYKKYLGMFRTALGRGQ